MEIPEPLIATLVAATQEVFETMVFKPVALDADADGPRSAGPHIVATIAFAGYRCGFVSFCSAIDTAQEIAGAMLGLEPSAVNGQVTDAIGEIANMIAGTVRTRMAEVEPPWAISVPTVTIGSDFATIYMADVARAVRVFNMDGHSIAVELILHKPL